MLKGYERLGDARIVVRFVEGERSFAVDAFETLAARLTSIAELFGVSGEFPKVMVVLVPNRDEIDQLVRDLLQVEIEVLSHPAHSAQRQRTDMVVLSPPAYAEHSVYEYVPNEFRRLLVHELVHMMEGVVSPDIETTTGWWSEGLAVYFSEQSRFEDEFRRMAFQGTAMGEIPRLEGIRRSEDTCNWGWTLVRFIECRYGREKLMRTVRECSDGAVLSHLCETKPTIEPHWREWLLAHRNLIWRRSSRTSDRAQDADRSVRRGLQDPRINGVPFPEPRSKALRRPAATASHIAGWW